MSASAIIKIAYADDHDLMRKGVIELVSVRNTCKFIIEAGNGEELIRKVKTAPVLPDICVLDIVMPVMDGFATIAGIRQHWPQMKILILTGHNSDYHLKKMILAGANGYLLKSCAPAELERALRTIHKDGIYHSETMNEELFHLVKNNHDEVPDISEREAEFLRLCCSELKYDEIARKMFVSAKTIDWYRTCLFKKLNITSRSGLVMYAVQLGPVQNSNPTHIQ